MFSVGFMLQFTAGVDFNGSFYATMYLYYVFLQMLIGNISCFNLYLRHFMRKTYIIMFLFTGLQRALK